MTIGACPVLQGYEFSVYHRMARIALHEKQVSYKIDDVNPFDDNCPNDHPFGRVPTFFHAGNMIYETRAITSYIDCAFPGSSLGLADPIGGARIEQCLSLIDNYAYWPLVRQVFSHAVFRPMMGEQADTTMIEAGLKSAPLILEELEKIVQEGIILNGKAITRADCHLSPIIGYFQQAAAGKTLLNNYPSLQYWFEDFAKRKSYLATQPDFGPLG